jgi:hypothetical protein
MKIRNYRNIPATTPMPGVSKRVPIGPEEGAPNFIMPSNASMKEPGRLRRNSSWILYRMANDPCFRSNSETVYILQKTAGSDK